MHDLCTVKTYFVAFWVSQVFNLTQYYSWAISMTLLLKEKLDFFFFLFVLPQTSEVVLLAGLDKITCCTICANAFPSLFFFFAFRTTYRTHY